MNATDSQDRKLFGSVFALMAGIAIAVVAIVLLYATQRVFTRLLVIFFDILILLPAAVLLFMPGLVLLVKSLVDKRKQK